MPLVKNKDLTILDLKKIGKRVYRKYIIYKLLTDKRYRKLWIKKHL